MWGSRSLARFYIRHKQPLLYFKTCVLTGRVTFMCGPPWYDEQDGHADVGQHREHQTSRRTTVGLA